MESRSIFMYISCLSRISFQFFTRNTHLSYQIFISIFFIATYSFLFSIQIKPVEEPEKMTEIIVKALEITGHRGIINKGWGGLGNCKSWYLSWFHEAHGILVAADIQDFDGYGCEYLIIFFQWQNQRTFCTYWTIAPTTGFSRDALPW